MYTRSKYKFKFNRARLLPSDLGFGGENNAINEPVVSPPICLARALLQAAARRKCTAPAPRLRVCNTPPCIIVFLKRFTYTHIHVYCICTLYI